MRTISSWALVLLAVASLPASGRSKPEPEDAGALAGGSEPLRLAGELRPGNHAVGFRKETHHLDPGALGSGIPRNEIADFPTALDLYIWFPVAGSSRGAGARRALTLGDYYRAQETDPVDDETLRQWLLDDMTSPPGVATADLDRVLSAPMWASFGGDALEGRHPLVLWSYRDSIPTMQAVLNEFLASHGYVVVFAWPTDNAPPLPWQGDLSGEAKRAALEVQVRLLQVVLEALGARPWVDTDRNAVLAWSYGGESANLLQRRSTTIRLALGVDATLAGGGVFLSAEEWEELDPTELTVPYVLLRNGRPRLGAETRPAPPLLARVPAGAWHVRFPPLSHGNFNVPGGLIPGVLGLSEVSRWAVGGDTARRGYELVCRYALGFLDRFLRPEQLAPDPAEWIETAPGEVEIERYAPHRPEGGGAGAQSRVERPRVVPPMTRVTKTHASAHEEERP